MFMFQKEKIKILKKIHCGHRTFDSSSDNLILYSGEEYDGGINKFGAVHVTINNKMYGLKSGEYLIIPENKKKFKI